MNQILLPEFPEEKNFSYNNPKKKSSNIKFYKIQFFLFLCTAVILFFILLLRLLEQNFNKISSQRLTSIYQLSTLYSNNSDYTTSKVNTETFTNSNPFVIGMLKIDKINLNYPILSQTNSELLELSLCRFAGPMPNEVGNLCIAGHNYINDTLFGKLDEVELNDEIQIYDLNGQLVKYIVSNKYETNSNDINCTNQNTNGKKIVTLLTCNNITQKRLIIIAEQKS